MPQETIEGFRLSLQQNHLWSLQQDECHVPYRVQGTILVVGDLSIKTLELALEETIAQHEILRTTFPLLAGTTIPLQVLDDNNISRNYCYDMSGLDDHEQGI